MVRKSLPKVTLQLWMRICILVLFVTLLYIIRVYIYVNDISVYLIHHMYFTYYIFFKDHDQPYHVMRYLIQCILLSFHNAVFAAVNYFS